MADASSVTLNEEHAPLANAFAAFGNVEGTIKAPISAVSDDDLVGWSLKDDLVSIRSGPTAYGTILIGKLRIPAINDAQGEGFVHVRVHDPPAHGTGDVTFHSFFTDEVREDDKVVDWRAIQTNGRALEFFNE